MVGLSWWAFLNGFQGGCLAASLLSFSLAGLLGFVPLPPLYLAFVAAVVALYVVSAEATKALFYRHAAGARTDHGDTRSRARLRG
jgi:hypothetical protein